MSELTLEVFSADWCGPCDQQHEILDESYDATPVEYTDVDENVDRANEFSIRSVPTLVLLDEDGNPIRQWAGLTQPDQIEEAVSENR